MSVGIIGSGQLGRMLMDQLKLWGVACHVLSTDACAPCCKVADSVTLCDSLYSVDGLNGLRGKSDVLVCEIEHTNAKKLNELDCLVVPCPKILTLIQHKCDQKEFYKVHDIPTAPFIVLDARTPLSPIPFVKCVVKTDTNGYDGKGVQICDRRDLPPFFTHKVVIEEYIENAKELSVIVACACDGTHMAWSVVEMTFNSIDNVLDYTLCPALISPDDARNATQLAIDVVKKFKKIGNTVGIFAVEMFLSPNGALYVNEVAPRPHNSGHHTIEACSVSQYEQLARILTNAPIVTDPVMFCPSAMLNIMGSPSFTGPYKITNLQNILSVAQVYVHDYGKIESRPGRKLGHVTILGETMDSVREKLNIVKGMGVHIEPKP